MTWILKIYRKCNLMMRFSKYEFYNKYLNSVTLFRITSGVTWTQLYIYGHNFNSESYIY